MSDEQDRSNQQAMQMLVELAEKRTEMSTERTQMATERTKLATKRTILAAKRTYLNIERTLSVWIRTSLAVMVFGIAIDRFGLMFNGMTHQTGELIPHYNLPSTILGALLVVFSMFIAFASGIKFIGYTRKYKKEFSFPSHHQAALPIIYAFMTVFFGAVLLLFMLWIE